MKHPVTQVVLAVLMLAPLSGCETFRTVQLLKNGPGAEAQAADMTEYRKNSDLVMAQLYASAGITDRLAVPVTGTSGTALTPTALLSPIEWSAVITAGMNYADTRCSAYMHALFRLNRNKNTVVSELGLAGTAAAGAMAAAASAAKDVALVAIAFGFAASTISNVSGNVLYDLDPSSVQTLVRTLQIAYRENIGNLYTNRPGAEAAIRNYALLCTPANIESEVNLAVKKAKPDAAMPVTTNTPPSVTIASAASGKAGAGDGPPNVAAAASAAASAAAAAASVANDQVRAAQTAADAQAAARAAARTP